MNSNKTKGFKVAAAVVFALVLNYHTKYVDLLLLSVPLILVATDVIKNFESYIKSLPNLLQSVLPILLIWLVSLFTIFEHHIVGSILLLVCGFHLLLFERKNRII